MPKHKNIIPSIAKNICLPEPLVNRVDLILFSELQGRVPFGAWKEFITKAIEEKLERSSARQEANDKFFGGVK